MFDTQEELVVASPISLRCQMSSFGVMCASPTVYFDTTTRKFEVYESYEPNTGGTCTVEFILIQGVNDSQSHGDRCWRDNTNFGDDSDDELRRRRVVSQVEQLEVGNLNE